MRGNIRVFCRVRKDDRAENCLKYPSDQDIIALNPQSGKKMFNFDKVFEPSSTQEQVGTKTYFLLRAPDKVRISMSIMFIPSPNPMFDHLLESSHRDDSNKW